MSVIGQCSHAHIDVARSSASSCRCHILTAGAFMTMILPMIVFLLLQRAFVRGILAGSVK
jgi:ABC-type glycerol-3-phosphate transport system permease component